MTFFIPGVFRDEVEVFATDDEGSVHLGGDDCACEDTAADRDFASEGAFLVCRSSVRTSFHISDPAQQPHTNVCAFDCLLWCPEPQAHVLVPSSPTLADFRAFGALCLLVDEDMGLLLESALRLYGQLCRHDCGVIYPR